MNRIIPLSCYTANGLFWLPYLVLWWGKVAERIHGLAMSQRQQHARNVWEFQAAAPAVAAAVNTVGLARADEARASFNLDAAIRNRLAAEHFATAARIVAESCF